MKKSAAWAGAVALPITIIGSFLIGAVPAQASTCSSATGGNNDRLVKANNSNTDSKGWNCGYVWTTGNKSISGWGIQTVISSTANGYQKEYDCTLNSSSVSVSKMYVDGGGTVGSAMTYSVGNSSTSTRHWTGALLWMTKTNGGLADGQRNSGCADYTIYFNAFYENTVTATPGATSGTVGTTVPVTVNVSAPNGPVPNLAKGAVVFLQLGSAPSPKTDKAVGQADVTNGTATVQTTIAASGPATYYAVFQGSNYTTMVPSATSQGWIPGQSKTFTLTGNAAPTSASGAMAPSGAERAQQVVRSRATAVFAVEKHGKGELSVSCPVGSAMQSFAAGSDTRVFDPQQIKVNRGGAGISVNAGSHESFIQVGCRNSSAKAEIDGKRGYGSVKDDVMTLKKAGSLFTGGLGNDVLTAKVAKAHLDGGIGNDRLDLRDGGTALGGFGDDDLSAEGGGAILLGGAGKDTFRTGSGDVKVNAKDGKGGDRISCGSAKTQVMLDKGDTFTGPCTIVKK
jgi:hypothetical protein